MDIGPVNNNMPDQRPNRKSPENRPTEKSAEIKVEDKVEISLEARKRLSDLAGKAKTSEIDTNKNNVNGQKRLDNDVPEKASTLEEIRKRIDSGFYDQPDIIDKIADKLSDDIET